MAESKLSKASHVAQLVGLVPSFICCYYAMRPNTPVSTSAPLGGVPMSGLSPKLLVSFGVALACFVIGGILSGLSWLENRRKVKEPDAEDQFYRDTTPREIIGFGGSGTLEEAQTEHARVFALGNQLDGLFCPLQIKALRIAHDLTVFLRETGPAPEDPAPVSMSEDDRREAIWEGVRLRTPWGEKLYGGYQRRFVPRIDTLLLEFSEKGISEPVLRHVFKNAKKPSEIEEVRNRLIVAAHRISGADLGVREDYQ